MRNAARAAATAQTSVRDRKSSTRCVMVVDHPDRRWAVACDQLSAVFQDLDGQVEHQHADREVERQEPEVELARAEGLHLVEHRDELDRLGPARPPEHGVGVARLRQARSGGRRGERPDRRDDLVPRQRAEEQADRHEHHADRRQADRQRDHRAEVEVELAPGSRGTAGRSRTAGAGARYIDHPGQPLGDDDLGLGHRARSAGSRSCPIAAPRRAAAWSGRGWRPAGRSRTACCPRCRCSAGRAGPRTTWPLLARARRPASRS